MSTRERAAIRYADADAAFLGTPLEQWSMACRPRAVEHEFKRAG